MKPSVQCATAAKKANQALGQLCRAVSYRDRVTFLNLYKKYVRPHLEYAVQAWSPWTEKDQHILEHVQMRAVRMISGLKGATYEDRLSELGLTTLKLRRERGDLIEVYKILTGKECVNSDTWFRMAASDMCGMNSRNTTGLMNIARRDARLEIRRNFFSERVRDSWNHLNDYVKSSSSLNEFKTRYDAFMSKYKY